MDVDGPSSSYSQRGPGDPYEFDEEGMTNVRMDTFKRGTNNIKVTICNFKFKIMCKMFLKFFKINKNEFKNFD